MSAPSAAVTPTETTTISRLRWVMVGFAFFATLIIYFDRQALAIVSASPDFKKAVPLSESQYGNITAAFMLAYTIMNGLSGPFIDAVGTRIGYACCLLWWAVAGILHVFTRSALYLGGCRFMIGASEAGNWPAAAKMISEWFPSKERALASGIFNSGASVAALVSFPLIAWIVVHWGWKSAFVTMSLFGFLWIIAWWFFAPKQSGVGVIVPKRVPARELLSTRFVIVFTISKAFMDPAWYFFVFWFPKYLSSTFHFTLREIGWKGSAPYVTAFLGNIAGGALTALFIRLGVANSTARKISTTLFALAMTSIIPASFTTNAPVAIALVSLTTFGYTGCLANALAFPAEVFPKHAVASVYGLASMGSGLGGILFSYLAGHLIEHYHSYQQVFIGYGIMPLVFLFCILFLLGPLKPNPKFQEPEAQAA